MRILEIRNPGAFQTDLARDLYERAFRNPEHGDSGATLKWSMEFAANDAVSIFFAMDDYGKLTGLMILEDSSDPFVGAPWVLHFYAEGAAETAALTEQIRSWMHSRGRKKVRILNRTGRSDEAHMRLFRKFGTEGRRLGGLIEYEVEEVGGQGE